MSIGYYHARKIIAKNQFVVPGVSIRFSASTKSAQKSPPLSVTTARKMRQLLLLLSSCVLSTGMLPSVTTPSLNPPLLPPHPPMVVAPFSSVPAHITAAPTLPDDDYDQDNDDLGNAPQLAHAAGDTVAANAADKEQDSATDIMRLMRGGRGRKSVFQQHNPKPELKHCYSAEPGGQRGSWQQTAASTIPVWQNNKRCSNLPPFDKTRAVQCMTGTSNSAANPLTPNWLVLVGDANMHATYLCLTGILLECKGIGDQLRTLGYERLYFGPTVVSNPGYGTMDRSVVADSDTFFAVPSRHNLAPLRISFRRITTNNVRGSFLENMQHTGTRDWNKMLNVDGTLRVEESWLSTNGVSIFGHVPQSLLFSAGASNVANTQTKDCTVARNAGTFLKATDRSIDALWVSVGGVSIHRVQAAVKGEQHTLTAPPAPLAPTNQQLLWDAECSRMQAKLHRIPFVDVAARTMSAEIPPYPNIYQQDGSSFGVALYQDVIRNWLPWLCHEVRKVQEK